MACVGTTVGRRMNDAVHRESKRLRIGQPAVSQILYPARQPAKKPATQSASHGSTFGLDGGGRGAGCASFMFTKRLYLTDKVSSITSGIPWTPGCNSF